MIELLILLKATVLLVLGLMAARLFVHAQAAVRHLWLAATLAALAVGGAVHRVAGLAERRRQLLREPRFVFDDQYPHGSFIAHLNLNGT